MTQRAPALDLMLRAAQPTGSDGRASVPEHLVKGALSAWGIDVPQGVIGRDAAELEAAGERTLGRHAGPLVLKAFGEGLVHKTDLGGVTLGVTRERIAAEVGAMTEQLGRSGVTPSGFILEEQIRAGTELLVGVVHNDPFGHVVMLGMGGTLTEILDRAWTRLAPLTPADAASLVDELPDALLAGARGAAPVDKQRLIELLLALAGDGGLVAGLGPRLAELECNPVIAASDRVVAADARLLVREPSGQPGGWCAPTEPTDFTAVFSPRSVAVAGASTSRSIFGNWFLQAYRDMGWAEGLYAVHPTATHIDGIPAVASLAEVPGGVDYLLSAVPASRSAALVQENGPHVRFVHVVSGGFAEVGPDGAAFEADLVAAARATGSRVLGPNCMGAFSPAGRQTFFRGAPTEPGTVGVVSQSGSLAGEIVRTGDARGLRFSRLATLGNGADVTPGEMLAWLVDDPETAVIGLYLEGPRDPDLVEALRRARGRKPIVVLAGGLSRQGSAAVASHTGALAGDARVWAAVSASLGVTVVHTLEHFLAALAYLQRFVATPVDPDGGVLLVGPGGGASVLATDALDRAGLRLPVTPEPVVERLQGLGYGAGTSVRNPVEIPLGPKAPADAFEPVAAQLLAAGTHQDLLLHANVASYYGFGDGGLDVLVETIGRIGAVDWGRVRVGLVLRSADAASGVDNERLRAAARAADVVAFRDFSEAAVALAAAQRFSRHA